VSEQLKIKNWHEIILPQVQCQRVGGTPAIQKLQHPSQLLIDWLRMKDWLLKSFTASENLLDSLLANTVQYRAEGG
jgi:hypothetical protein